MFYFLKVLDAKSVKGFINKTLYADNNDGVLCIDSIM